jgi:hypothetical protein
MDFETRNNNNNNSRIRSVYDYTMGVLWFAVGVFFLFQKKLGYDLQLDKTLTGIFGVSSLLYGSFRIYRGFKKN